MDNTFIHSDQRMLSYKSYEEFVISTSEAVSSTLNHCLNDNSIKWFGYNWL